MSELVEAASAEYGWTLEETFALSLSQLRTLVRLREIRRNRELADLATMVRLAFGADRKSYRRAMQQLRGEAPLRIDKQKLGKALRKWPERSERPGSD